MFISPILRARQRSMSAEVRVGIFRNERRLLSFHTRNAGKQIADEPIPPSEMPPGANREHWDRIDAEWRQALAVWQAMFLIAGETVADPATDNSA